MRRKKLRVSKYVFLKKKNKTLICLGLEFFQKGEIQSLPQAICTILE